MSAEILIVDDNADIRNIINELILDAGYKTRIAANYNQALTEIDNKLPDVAILDVKLDKGDNDGIELLSHIKSKNKDVPVIIISGHANIEMAIKSLQKGAFEFIEFFIKFKKTLFSCSLSPSKLILGKLFSNLILIEVSNSCNNLIFSIINSTRSFCWKMGLGILAKSENSLTNFSICLIWLLIIFKFSL